MGVDFPKEPNYMIRTLYSPLNDGWEDAHVNIQNGTIKFTRDGEISPLKLREYQKLGMARPKVPNPKGNPNKSKGGPSNYYDFPDGVYTTNDAIEYLGGTRWKGDSFALGETFKALVRWGTKDGTSKLYDLRKMVYYCCRLIMKYEGQDKLHEVIKEIMDDKQFNRKGK